MTKPDTPPLCPKCGGKLLYDGSGLSCISCAYVWRKPNSVRSVPGPKDPPEGK